MGGIGFKMKKWTARWLAMKNLFLNHALLASLILYGFTSLMPAKAQPAWPAAKPIRVIVNFPPGGEPLPISPSEFSEKIAEDAKRFATLIKEQKITGD